MRRVKRLALVLMAFGLVTSAIYATGAFSDLTAQRNADVAVTGDASGYLALRPATGPNGAYASYENGQLQVMLGKAISTSGTTGRGLNPNAVTTVKNVFTITNQGSQTIGLWLTDGSDAVTFKVGGRSIEAKKKAITLKPGTPKTVSIVVDTRRVGKDTDLLNSVTFHASSTVAETGAPAQGGSGSGSKLASSEPSADTPTDNKRSSKPSTPPPTPKQKEDDGFDPLNYKDYLNVGGDIVEGVINIGSDFFAGIANWGREKILEKFRYLTGQPWDALYSLGETAWNTLFGFAFGEIGMPGGPFTAREAHSVFYLGGSMLSVLNPIVDTLAGFRDFVAYLVKGDAIGAAIEALGLFPVGDLAGDLGDLKSITQKWVKYNPGTAKRMLQPMYDMFLKHIPNKGVRQAIVDLFPGSAKRSLQRGDEVKSVASKSKKYPVDIEELAKKKKHIGYTTDRMRWLANNKKYTTKDLEELAKQGINLKVVEKLSKKGLSKTRVKTLANARRTDLRVVNKLSEEISMKKVMALTKTGADLEVANRLARRGFSGDQLVDLGKHGTDARRSLKLTFPEAEELINVGYRPGQIVSIAKNSERTVGYTKDRLTRLVLDDGFTGKEIKNFAERGADLEMVETLSKNGFSKAKLDTLTKHRADLKVVETLSESGVSKATIGTLAKTNADLEAANRLSQRGFSDDQLVEIAKHGTDARRSLKLTLPETEELMDAGYKPDQIVSLSKNSKWRYRAGHALSNGITTDQLITLRKKDVPVDDVKFYVEKAYSLKLVIYLREKGHSSKLLRKYLDSPEKVKKSVEEARKGYSGLTTGTSIAYSIYGWCKMKGKRNKSVALCPT
jgi:hypothetical protein